MSTSEHLDRSFRSFIDTDDQKAFFTGLAEYVSYVFETPSLKDVFDSYIEERNGKYKEVGELEAKTLLEMGKAEQKMRAVIEKYALDPKTFKRFGQFDSLSTFSSPLLALDYVKANTILQSKYRSDTIHQILFEIAANLKRLGYENEIVEYVASPDAYDTYWKRIKKPSEYVYFRDDGGMFIFSETWPMRYEAIEKINAERKTRPWGSFEALLNFYRAYEEVSRAGGFETLIEGDISGYITADEAVEAALMVDDIKIILGDAQNTLRFKFSHLPTEIRYLHTKTYRLFAHTAHNRLMRTIEEEPPDYKQSYWITKVGLDFYFDGNKIHFKNSNAKYVRIFAAVFTLLPQGGSVPYEEIISQYKKTNKKAIQRALTGEYANFFRYVPSVKRMPVRDTPLFEATTNGKELMFNNKK